jgi:hypothetical protein
MAKPKGGLSKWFKEKWVDISRPKKKGKYQPCGRGKAKTSLQQHRIKATQIN